LLIRMRPEVQVLPGPLPATSSENARPRYVRSRFGNRILDDTS
jgi:hypothetical protein